MPPLAAEPPHPDDPAPTPSDDKLISFLHLKLAGEALPAAAGSHFHESDIYAADPAMLTAGYLPAPVRKGEGCSWFFFTLVRPKSKSDSRKKRMVGGGAGTWHSERAPRTVLDGEGNCVGHTQYFSYKRKTGKNCSERTDWYMLEFTDGPEGDHDRIQGGEPVLVLCKIYKAHSGSRSSSSSSSSRSARKRKSTEEHADPSSAPVKAKRQLFSSSAPTQLPTSQEQVSNTVAMATPRLESQGEAAKFEQEACHGGISFDALGELAKFMESETNSTSDCLNFSTNLEAWQELVTSRVTMETSGLELQCGAAKVDPEAYQGKTNDETVDDALLYWELQCKTNSTLDYHKFSPDPEASALPSMTSTTIPSSLMSKTDMSQAKIGDTSDYLRFWPEPEFSQGMLSTTSGYLKFSPEAEAVENVARTTPPSLVMSGPGMTAQGKIGGTSDYLRVRSDLINSPTPSLLTSYPWKTSQGNVSNTADCFTFSSEQEASQGMINGTSPSSLTSEPWMTFRFESELNALQDKSDYLTCSPKTAVLQQTSSTPPKASQGASEYVFSPETEALQRTSATVRRMLMFEPEVQARRSESETSALDWGIQMASVGTTPVPVNCNDNSITASWSCGLGWIAGSPPKYDSPSMFGSPALWSY
jgi:hypothetical protein